MYVTPEAADFRPVALPAGLSSESVVRAVARMQQEWSRLDSATRTHSGVSFYQFIAGDEPAAASQAISRRIVASIASDGIYVRANAQRFPDLRAAADATIALEVKANRYPNPAQGHSADSGWFLVFRYSLSEDAIPQIVEIRIGYLDASQIRLDGKRAGSKRTETASLRGRDLAHWYVAKRAARARTVKKNAAPAVAVEELA